MKKPLRWLATLTALLLPIVAMALQKGLEIDIVGGNASALPIAVVPMPYQGSAGAPATDVAAVVRSDLDRSGQFRGLPEVQIVERPTRGSEVKYPTWRALKQDYLVVGRVLDAGAGAYRVEYELFDVAKGERMLGLAMTARSNAMRDVAHQMADAIYEKITGVRGAFWTRIAYVTAKAGIPVVSMNSGSDVAASLGVLGHVGQDEYPAGVGAGAFETLRFAGQGLVEDGWRHHQRLCA